MSKWTSTKHERERFVLGAEDGIYVSTESSGFERVVEFEKVTQIDVIEKFGLVIALGGKTRQIRIWPKSLCIGIPNKFKLVNLYDLSSVTG